MQRQTLKLFYGDRAINDPDGQLREWAEDIAEIQAARVDYKAGDYMTFDEYKMHRAERSA